ncbi:AAA family ATPase [Bradyrhizobium sp. 62B]|uniref:AAA family ATPase n=1 Tax=Bradyrhizobium sp. 62B TaxID=2898442 RepID=UPI002557FB78|nr:AAA family ATPase [Bradyrhizobium sp. 62B]
MRRTYQNQKGISSDAEETPPRGRKARKGRINDTAHEFSHRFGGEPEDWVDEAERLEPHQPKQYRDDDLTGAGFAEKKAYDYTDKAGKLLYQVVRYEHPGIAGAKHFRQRRPNLRSDLFGNVRWLADAGLVKVPYNWKAISERPSEPVYYVEGEKDADTLSSIGLLATTLASQSWSAAAAKALTGRDVIIIPDKDDKGSDNADKAIRNLTGFAASIRLLRLPGLGRREDVSDWLTAGHDKEELLKLVEATPSLSLKLRPLDFSELSPDIIPARDWLYGRSYIRQYLSLLLSLGGSGKSSKVVVESLAMVSGKALLGLNPSGRLRVWYHNGEDPMDELHRRFAAAVRHHKLSAEDIGNRLFITSGRTWPIILAEQDERRRAISNKQVVDDLISQLRERKIDVMILDPFASCHRVSENSNDDVQVVAEAMAAIAERAGCAVMVVHHTRKGGGDERTAEDGRGAVALINAARSCQVINTMTKHEAEKAEIEESERRLYFRADDGKPNLARPSEWADWYRLISHDLGNGKGRDFDQGDSVGVVESWSFPRTAEIRLIEILRVMAVIRSGGPWRLSSQASSEPWVGIPIAETLDRDLGKPAHKKEINGLIKAWINQKWLKVVLREDRKRIEREYVEVGKPPSAPGSEGGEEKEEADRL